MLDRIAAAPALFGILFNLKVLLVVRVKTCWSQRFAGIE